MKRKKSLSPKEALAVGEGAVVWQADCFPAPVPLQDGEQAGFPPAALVIDAPSRFIHALRVFPFGTPPGQALVRALSEAMGVAGRVPAEVHLRKGAEGLVEVWELARTAGFKIVVPGRLHALDEVRRDMEQAMKRRLVPPEGRA